MNIFKRNNHQAEIAAMLTQIYGELNRIRLSMHDKKRAKNIEAFDREFNFYIPFHDSPDNAIKYFSGNPKKK